MIMIVMTFNPKIKTLMFCFRVKGCLPTLSVRGGATYSRSDSFYIEKDKEKIKNIRETLKMGHTTLSHLLVTGQKLEWQLMALHTEEEVKRGILTQE